MKKIKTKSRKSAPISKPWYFDIKKVSLLLVGMTLVLAVFGYVVFQLSIEKAWVAAVSEAKIPSCADAKVNLEACQPVKLSTVKFTKEVGASCQLINQAEVSKFRKELADEGKTPKEIEATVNQQRSKCVALAYIANNWRVALLQEECQKWLLFDQKTLTGTGGDKKKEEAIAGMQHCWGGLTGRKHPVATKDGQTKDVPRPWEANIDKYQSEGWDVSWEEYKTFIKGACLYKTEVKYAIPGESGGFKWVCAPVDQDLPEGGVTCHSSGTVKSCCPTGQTIVAGKCATAKK